MLVKIFRLKLEDGNGNKEVSCRYHFDKSEVSLAMKVYNEEREVVSSVELRNRGNDLLQFKTLREFFSDIARKLNVNLAGYILPAYLTIEEAVLDCVVKHRNIDYAITVWAHENRYTCSVTTATNNSSAVVKTVIPANIRQVGRLLRKLIKHAETFNT